MRKVFYVISFVAIAVISGWYINPLISGDSIYQQVKKLDKVLNIAAKNYVEEVDTQKLVEAAIKGMLNELDVHSVFIPAEEMKRVNEDFSGSFDGIGVEFDILNDTITIVTAIQGGPSEMLGILSGDKICKIDNKDVIGIDRSDVPKKLKGPKGTIVEVDIKRSGMPDLIHFKIVRDKIPLTSVDGSFMIDGTDIGVVVISRFSSQTHSEMMQALRTLKTQGMKKLIMDLRWNPGGFLNQATQIADEFLPKGDTIVYTKGRTTEFNEVFTALGGDEYEKTPLIVLINAGSASASEIVSGAIQDLDRGLIVGETSYGKGLVQRQYDIGDGSSFRLTISKYYTPSGRSIQRPYKDKDQYRHLVGRFELEEGSYIEDGLAKIREQIIAINEKEENSDKKKKDIISLDSLPLYNTRSGRLVFGGGGINPDYIVKPDTTTRFYAELRAKNLFFEYSNSYLQGKGKDTKKKYENNFTDFLRKFEINENMLAEFKKLAEEKGITWNDEQYKTDKEYVKIAIKATIARSLWDRNKYYQIFFAVDNQVLKAVELFPDAVRIAGLK